MRRHTLSAIIVASLLLSGCTLVPTNAANLKVKDSRVPFGLLKKTIPGTSGAKIVFTSQPVYFVRGSNHLVAVNRVVAKPAKFLDVLNNLVSGPTPLEMNDGLRSDVPTNTAFISAQIIQGTGFVNLAKPLAGPNTVAAVGQIVWTAQALGAVDGVEIFVGDIAHKVTLPGGATSVIATPGNYASWVH